MFSCFCSCAFITLVDDPAIFILAGSSAFLIFQTVEIQKYCWRYVESFGFVSQTVSFYFFLLNDQRDAQLFSMYLFIFLTLYMFRAHRAHHQERQIVSIQPLVAVGGRVVCRSEVSLPTCTQHDHRHRVTATRVCIDTICLS